MAVISVAGIWSGAIYFDRSLYAMGFLGEGKHNASVIAVKSHWYVHPSFKDGGMREYDKAIHLVRNPFHAIVAERKRLVVRHAFHTSQPSWTTFVNGIVQRGESWRMTSKMPWDAWMDAAIQRWNTTVSFVDEIKGHSMPLFTLRYENLVSDVKQTMAGVLEFIGTVCACCTLLNAAKTMI